MSQAPRPTLSGVTLACVCALALLGYCAPSKQSTSERVPTAGDLAYRAPTPASREVEYTISGTASRAFATYTNAQGGTEQIAVSLPWRYSFNGAPGSHLYVSAQNEGSRGSVQVRISVGARTVRQSNSEGAYVIATASARL